MSPVDDILKEVRDLPTLPSAIARLSALVGDPSANADDFEAVIRPDPSLTANLLRLANSAYFGLPREVGSVRQAVILLGIKRVFELAAGASFTGVIPERIPGYGINATDFWQHSLAVAALSERLASDLRVQVPDMTFTAGLLHDIGKIAVGAYLQGRPEALGDEARKEGVFLIDAERALMGFDHGEVGETVGEQWSLPPAIVQGARWHHAPGDAPPGADRTMIDLIHAADGLAHALGLGADVGELSRRVDGGVIERLGIGVQRLERVAGETVDDIRAMGELLASGAAV
ncbi:MAG: HDOD domain-containing protein [Candidatus Eisenbacteria bacterium]